MARSAPNLSLVVIAQDEERDLPACLGSARGLADEAVVVDGGSRDRTRERAREAGARVLERAFDGYVEQKAFALAQAQGDWVLSLDADERLSPGLREELAALKARAFEGPDAYELPRRVEFLGRRLRHGGVGGERVLRLFRRGAARAAGGRLHERLQVQGPVGRLREPIEHRPYADLSEYLAKLDRYASLGARQAFEDGRRPRPWDHAVPVLEFGKRYLLQLGVLDGGPGLAWCVLAAFSAWLKRMKLRELAAGASR